MLLNWETREVIATTFGERYRGRRKRFGLRFNLIAGVHNFELGLIA